MRDRAPRILFAGGGTGGHLYPAIAVARELQARHEGARILFVGTRRGIESRVVPAEKLDIQFIASRGVRGRGAVGAAVTAMVLAAGVLQAIRIVTGFAPDIVFGSGGYASAAVVIAASALRRRIVLQEQNSIPGLTNRKLARRAERIYLGFESAGRWLAGHPGLLVTGNPLRRELFDETGDARGSFGFDERPVLLVFGGSQGARTLNDAAAGFLAEATGVQGIVQTGERDYERIARMLAPAGRRVRVVPYIEAMHLAYRAADVVLSRAGALSVAEIAAVGLPAILVPYPHAADDHQSWNARALVDAGGAVSIADANLDGGSLAAAVRGILEEPGQIERMKKALGRLPGGAGATGAIADDMDRLLADAEGNG